MKKTKILHLSSGKLMIGHDCHIAILIYSSASVYVLSACKHRHMYTSRRRPSTSSKKFSPEIPSTSITSSSAPRHLEEQHVSYHHRSSIKRMVTTTTMKKQKTFIRFVRHSHLFSSKTFSNDFTCHFFYMNELIR